MPGAILTLTEREVEVLGYALLMAYRHYRTQWEAAPAGHYRDDYYRKMQELRDLRDQLDAAPAAPLATWSDHDRNVPADEQEAG